MEFVRQALEPLPGLLGLVIEEMDLRVLARDYMTGWFVIDVASIAPSALDFLPVIMSSQGSNDTEEGEGETEGTGGLRVSVLFSAA